jgi:TetR/AcrR family transcriptional regulator, mexJK operon transcriptional repressor
MATPAAAAKPARDKETGSSARKHRAILDAALKVFLRSGYLGANMEEIAALSAVSKQTIYKHFSSKEALFVEIVTSMTDAASATVHSEIPEISEDKDIVGFLQMYAYRQLTVVVTPRLMQLRRLVIGEVARFPELARVLYERGPQRSAATLAQTFKRLAGRGLLVMDDPLIAASNFNWLIMSEPLNRAMLLGDEAIPKATALRRHAAEGVRVFLAAYGKK